MASPGRRGCTRGGAHRASQPKRTGRKQQFAERWNCRPTFVAVVIVAALLNAGLLESRAPCPLPRTARAHPAPAAAAADAEDPPDGARRSCPPMQAWTT